jgi:hypothetical protein
MPDKVSGLKPKYEPIDFNGDCIDPIAKLILTEAMDYAIESALEAVNKSGDIFSSVGQAGTAGLRSIKGIRDIIAETPSCDRQLTPSELKLIELQGKKETKSTAKSPTKVKPKKTEPKPATLPELLTPESWNTLPVSVRNDIVSAAEVDKSGGTAAGSFTPEEFAKLKLAFEQRKSPKPRLVKLAVVKKQDPETGILQQIGFDVIRADKDIDRISVAEGAQLIADGKAYII